MPGRINTEMRVVQGKKFIVVETDNGWRFGPVEGRWYIGMFIFAIIVLLYNLAWPWAYETATGSSWRFRQNAPAPVHQVVAPVVPQQPTPPAVYAPAPTPTPAPAPAPAPSAVNVHVDGEVRVVSPSPAPVSADPTAGLSPEDKRLYERLVLRK